MFCNVPLQSLPVGARLGNTIYDERQTKLLAAGVQITDQLLDTLQRRNIGSVIVGQQDLGRILAFRPQGKSRTASNDRRPVRSLSENDGSRELDRLLADAPLPQLRPSLQPFSKKLKPTSGDAYDAGLLNFLAEQHEDRVRDINGVVDACGRRDSVDLALIGEAARSSLEEAITDCDAYACLGANPHSFPYPTRHVLHTAMLATSIGVKLGLGESTLHELSVGCMIHDIGMLCVDRMTIGAKKFLDQEEFIEIAKHPIHTFDLIEKNLDEIPVGARMVAYQMHERANGSGYPRGRTLQLTHPLARIAAVADTYTALVSARPHRSGMMPYYAIEKLVRDTAKGVFDPAAVRGLLQAVSLFPIGSFVEISDGYVGRVIRSNAFDYTRPIVEAWKRGRTSLQPAIIDLWQEPHLRVVRPLQHVNE